MTYNSQCFSLYGSRLWRLDYPNFENLCTEEKGSRVGMYINFVHSRNREQMYLPVSEIKPCVHPDLGEWGDWEECPPGEHVKGMQLRIEAKIDLNLI